MKERVFKIAVCAGMDDILKIFTREELRSYATDLGVKIGKNKFDTLWNIIESGKGKITVKLGG